jgi:hypothetical protein
MIGFPTECPANCPCKTYDCSSTQWTKRCGFSEGFCDMMTKTPPEYKINYIRVYQDPENEKHKVGCSTPERPTRKYILAHEDVYKTEDDVSEYYLKAIGVSVSRFCFMTWLTQCELVWIDYYLLFLGHAHHCRCTL